MSLKETAAEVLRIVERGRYQVGDRMVDIAGFQAAAVSGTRLYTPDEVEALPSAAGSVSDSGAPAPRVRIVDGTTQRVAHDLSSAVDGHPVTGRHVAGHPVTGRHVAVLNYASARNPGGGFLNGAKAQEEDLCRCSGLYPCLLQCPEYYQANRAQKSLLYTDHAIFSPLVPFFKVDGSGDLLPDPFLASVITAPAPNSRPFLAANPGAADDLEATFERRWRNVLRIARDQGVSHLLLGAWGCGAFGGDPVLSSTTAKRAVGSDGGGLTEIVFAIPGHGRQSSSNLAAFETTFGTGS